MTIFKNRVQAGQLLADALTQYAGRKDVIVLGLPRGGVPVAFEVAKRLGAPLDVFVVRKLGVPWHRELAMGAIATGGVRVLNEHTLRELEISEATIDAVAAEELKELARREVAYRGHNRAPVLRGKTVLLVDDGIATGSTMRAAIKAIQQQQPARLVVAVPTAAAESFREIREQVDEMVALMTPEDFLAVGQWYEDFSQTTDADVTRLLREAKMGEHASPRKTTTVPLLTLAVALSLLLGCHSTRAAPEDGTNAPASGSVAATISTKAAEVIQLMQSGVEEPVIMAYVEGSSSPFALAADDIIYLKDVGVSAEIITAMLHRDAVLREAHEEARPPAVEAIKPVPSTNQPVTQVAYVTNAPTEVRYFYEPLTPYGTWIEIDSRWYWQPHVVVIDRGWRPYCQGGRWIYSDYGWYWHSDYTWGWAPFHYGRWHHHHHHGWVWYPDLVWGPAWVTWRFSDAYWGWAPLPPGAHFVIGRGWYFNNISVGIDFDFHLGYDWFTYVEPRHFHHHRLHVHAVSPTHAKGIHVHTKVVNNHGAGPNKQIVNHGIAVDKVIAATKQDIRPARIVESPIVRGQPIKGDRLTTVGSSTVIQRPELKPPAQARPPVAQKVDDQRAIVRRAPERPPVSAPPRSAVRPVPSGVGAPAPTPQPGRPKTPAVTPPVRRVEPAPTPQRATPQHVQPVVPRPSAPHPARHETPRGQEQRLSNGPQMHRPQPPPAKPPSSRPQPQKGGEQRSRHS